MSGPSDRATAASGERGSEAATDRESGSVRANGIDTAYVRRGDGPPIVFIHGMFMNATEWEPQMAALSDEYTTIAYDVRGHGDTGGSDRDQYTIDLYAADLDALLTELGIENPVLCGLSMGGCIAQVYAATYPEKVAGLVLADTFAAGPLPWRGRLVFANLRVIAQLDRFVRYTTLNRLQMWVGDQLVSGVAGDRTTTQRVMENGPTIPHAEVVKIARSVAQFPQSEFDAARIDVPTLILHGEHLPAMFREMQPKLAIQLRNATVETATVPNAGHASNIDNPEFFSTAVREFLSANL